MKCKLIRGKNAITQGRCRSRKKRKRLLTLFPALRYAFIMSPVFAIRSGTMLLVASIIVTGILASLALFAEPNGHQVLIAGANVGLRTGPGVEHEIVGTVGYGDTVRILEEQTQIVTIQGRTGRWIKVAFRETEITTVEAWIFDAYVVREERFGACKKDGPRSIQFCIGDYCAHIRVDANGASEARTLMSLGNPQPADVDQKTCENRGGKFFERDPEGGPTDIFA